MNNIVTFRRDYGLRVIYYWFLYIVSLLL